GRPWGHLTCPSVDDFAAVRFLLGEPVRVDARDRDVVEGDGRIRSEGHGAADDLSGHYERSAGELDGAGVVHDGVVVRAGRGLAGERDARRVARPGRVDV